MSKDAIDIAIDPNELAPDSGVSFRSLREAKGSSPLTDVKERPVYVLRLRPEPGIDGARALRFALKRLLRDYGMRCLGARPE
jgi:hypothetical protein